MPLFNLVPAIVLLGHAAPPDRAYELMVGDPAPRLSVSRWAQGEPVRQFQKGKVYVVDFFATWCGPCKESIPVLNAMQKRLGTKATFIGMDVWDYQERVPDLLKKMGGDFSYAVALDTLPAIPADVKN